jgi:hypothetical protein
MQDELKKRKVANINFFRRVRIYRGIQHSHRLPVNVQRTRKINYFMVFFEILKYFLIFIFLFFINGFFLYDFELIIVSSILIFSIFFTYSFNRLFYYNLNLKKKNLSLDYVTYMISRQNAQDKFKYFEGSFTAKFYYVMCKLDYLLFTKKKVIENNISFFINFYSSFLDSRMPEMGKKLDSGDSAFHNDHDVEKANIPEKQSLQAETIFSPSIPDAVVDVDPFPDFYTYVTVVGPTLATVFVVSVVGFVIIVLFFEGPNGGGGGGGTRVLEHVCL